MNYIPASPEERQGMLHAVGAKRMADLFSHIPQELLLNRPLDLPDGQSEFAALAQMEAMAARNTRFATCLRGAGAYRHLIPSVVKHLAARAEFVTAYTPYQAEMSQGVLQGIFEYQSMICRLTGLDASNASVYDGAHAAAEGLLLCREKARRTAVACEPIHPNTLAALETYARGGGLRLIVIPHKNGAADLDALKAAMDATVCAVYMETPNFYGLIDDAAAVSEIAHGAGARLVVGVNPIALAVLPAPSEYGADVAVGEGQPLGLPLSYGGPYLGFMAVREELTRRLPGRVVGETVDKNGQRAFVLTLQAREQHIRREKASSSICSNQALCALTATIYLSAMGPQGLVGVAEACMGGAAYLAAELARIGFTRLHTGDIFHEFATVCPVDFAALEQALAAEGILCGLSVDGGVLWCVTEAVSKAEIDQTIAVIQNLKGGAGK